MWSLRIKPFPVLLGITFLLALSYGLFELSRSQQSPVNQPEETLIRESLDISETLFSEIEEEFLDQTRSLASALENTLGESTSRQGAYRLMQQYTSFWGASLLRNEQYYAWNGFTEPTTFPAPVFPDSLEVRLERRNNVTLLKASIPLQIREDDRWLLTTSERLEQRNVIPIAREQEKELSGHIALKNKFPVTFSFFDPMPELPDYYRPLTVAGQDSVGIVYADPIDMPAFTRSILQNESRWRTLFHVAFFLLGSALFFVWSYSNRSLRGLFFQLGIIITAWFLIIQSTTPVQWIDPFFPDLGESELRSLHAISYYATHAVFSFFVTFSVITVLTRKWRIAKPENFFQTFFSSFLLAALSLCLILFFLISSYQIGHIAQIPLRDLEMIPGIESWILFISTGFFLSSVLALLIACWWVLLVSEKDKNTVIGLIASVSFFFLYFIADLLLDFTLYEWRTLLLGFSLFGIALGAGLYIHRYPASFLQMSGFRLLLIIALVTSLTGYTIYAVAEEERIDQQLMDTATQFYMEEDDEAAEITFQLLSSIEQRLIYLSSEDLENRPSTVQSRFQRAIQSILRQEWQTYSFDIQLVRPNGELISDYATSIDSPGNAFYDMLRVETSYNAEQIRRDNNRPVIQSGPTAFSGDEYVTFYRGWIPIYDDLRMDRIIAWAIAAVYIERPDFNKPIRAVLAASAEDDWRSSYYLAKYNNGRLSRSTVKGIYANQPRYHRLSEQEQEIARNDSIAFISNLTAEGTFRELLFRPSEEEIVKVSTPLPALNHHLFSIFRFHIVILAAGLLLFPVLSLLGLKSFSLFGQNRMFRNRLLDGLAMVTLLLLIVLIVTTQYVISEQNETNLQREIVTKLDNLSESLMTGRGITQSSFGNVQDEPIPLSRATSPLDADAILYVNHVVAESTTPQIFHQNLLPQLLPFPVYDFLYNRERTHVVRELEVGGQPLLVGYRTVFNPDGERRGVIAIPTFLQSPVYTEQLLETTSYLMAFYLLLIGLFVIGTVLLATRLTQPLRLIREGLNQISGGDLDRTLPVRSQDEIGELSAAYNTMVSRLKELQSNLAAAEREAAWKEMARQIAHEIKNPLTPMKLNLQHLKRQLDSDTSTPEDVRKQVDRMTGNIIEQIESLNKIASDFSTFAHPLRDPFSRFDLNQMIRSLVDFYRPQLNGEVRHNLSNGPLWIIGSEDDLRRTMINLIKNGIEASGPDCEIMIRTARVAGKVLIEVRDNGNGIPEELQEKIFAPNFSTKSSGTGLGLAIAKKIVDAHHGTISFHSNNGAGTTFFIELPPAPRNGTTPRAIDS